MLKMFELILETLIKTQTNQTVNVNQLSMREKFLKFFLFVEIKEKKRKKSINHIVCVCVFVRSRKRTQAGHGQSYEFLKSKYNKKFMAFDMIPEVHPNFMDSIKNHIFLCVCLYMYIERTREKFTTTNIKC